MEKGREMGIFEDNKIIGNTQMRLRECVKSEGYPYRTCQSAAA